MRNARLEAQAGIKIARRNINNLRYADDTTLMAEREESLDESERGEWKSWLKSQHSKTKIMASGPITSWQIDRETVGKVRDFIWGGSKITADGDCSHEIKRQLLFGRKVMTNLFNILKSRDITDNGPYSQSYGFSSSHVWMWKLDHKEGWAPQNLCFWTVVLEKTLKRPLDCKEIKPVNSKGNESWTFIVRGVTKSQTRLSA